MRMISSAIITGPTGAIGMALCKLLTKKGVSVYAFVRPDSLRKEQLRDLPGVKVIECDAAQLGHLPKNTSDIYADAFFHLAWGATTGAGRNDMDVQIRNIQYTMDSVRAAAVFECDVFIGAGSQAEYGRVEHAPSRGLPCSGKTEHGSMSLALTPETPCFPENGYGMAKLCAEQMSRLECEKFGIAHVWPRILSVYGPNDGEGSMVMSTISKLLGGEKPSLTAGEQMWDYLYADDAAEALYRMALHGKNGAVYPLGSGKAQPLRRYIEALRDAIDPELPLGFGEIPYGEKQVMHLEADIGTLTEDTGFEPKVDFETGIRKTIEFVRSENHD